MIEEEEQYEMNCPHWYLDEFSYECCDIFGKEPPCGVYPQICDKEDKEC